MEGVISTVFGFLPSVAFCVVVWAIVLFIRSILDYACPSVRKSRFWKKVVLQAFPVVVGGVVAMVAKDYPFPEEFLSGAPHTFFGMFLGYISGHVYSAIPHEVRKYIKDKLPKMKMDSETN